MMRLMDRRSFPARSGVYAYQGYVQSWQIYDNRECFKSAPVLYLQALPQSRVQSCGGQAVISRAGVIFTCRRRKTAPPWHRSETSRRYRPAAISILISKPDRLSGIRRALRPFFSDGHYKGRGQEPQFQDSSTSEQPPTPFFRRP